MDAASSDEKDSISVRIIEAMLISLLVPVVEGIYTASGKVCIFLP